MYKNTLIRVEKLKLSSFPGVSIGLSNLHNDVFSFVDTPENSDESPLKLRFISVLTN